MGTSIVHIRRGGRRPCGRVGQSFRNWSKAHPIEESWKYKHQNYNHKLTRREREAIQMLREIKQMMGREE